MKKRDIELVATDFDDTLTEALPGADEAYREEHTRVFAERVGHESQRVRDAFVRLEAHVRANPGTYGMQVDGYVSVDAEADPFAMAQALADLYLKEVFGEAEAQAFDHNAVYQRCYLAREMAFRDDAVAMLEHLAVCKVPFEIFTNSDPKKVAARIRDKLPSMAALLIPLLTGYARKIVITSEGVPDGVPALARPPGLKRDQWLHRGHWIKIFGDFIARHGRHPSRVSMWGDIWEIDHDPIVRAHKIGHPVLLRKPNHPAWEIAAAKAHGSTRIIDSFKEIEDMF